MQGGFLKSQYELALKRAKESITLAIVTKFLAEVTKYKSGCDSLLCKLYYDNLILHVDNCTRLPDFY